MNNTEKFTLIKSKVFVSPNIWDLIVLVIILGILATVAWGAAQMATPYHVGEELIISLNPKFLPEYTIKTVLRMLIAMFFSLGFTFIVAPLAAKRATAGKMMKFYFNSKKLISCNIFSDLYPSMRARTKDITRYSKQTLVGFDKRTF